MPSSSKKTKVDDDELGDEVEGDLAEACATFWTKDLP